MVVAGFTFMPQTGSRASVGAGFGGFVDIQEGPASYYLGQVPGVDAILGYHNTAKPALSTGLFGEM